MAPIRVLRAATACRNPHGRMAAAPNIPPHPNPTTDPSQDMKLPPAAKAVGKEEEELFDEWQPGLCRATPERPIFTPTPPSSEGRLRRVDWDYD